MVEGSGGRIRGVVEEVVISGRDGLLEGGVALEVRSRVGSGEIGEVCDKELEKVRRYWRSDEEANRSNSPFRAFRKLILGVI